MSETSRRKPAAMLFGIGVGPGDPELLTLKALRVIQAAPVIAVPRVMADGVLES